MEIRYRRSLDKSYMIISPLERLYLGHEIKMFENNQIPGMVSYSLIVADGRLEAWYDITGKQTLEQWMGLCPINYLFMKDLMEALRKILEVGKNYLLKEDSIRMAPEYIMRDSRTGEFSVIYIPGRIYGVRKDLQTLLESIMQRMDHKDNCLAEFVYGLYEGVKKEEMPLRTFLVHKEGYELHLNSRQIEREPVEEVQVHQKTHKIKEKNVRSRIEGKILEWKKRMTERIKSWKDFSLVRKKELPVSYTPQSGLISETPTEFLGETESHIMGHLVYEGGEEEENFQVRTKRFLIGKGKDTVDGVLHSETVSRIHALIEREEDSYYLEDLNSSNGTFLNGIRLEYRAKVPLKHNDVIQFARQQYRFL